MSQKLKQHVKELSTGPCPIKTEEDIGPLLCTPTHTFIGIIILNFVIEGNSLLSRIEFVYACRRLSSVTLPSYITICDVILCLGFLCFLFRLSFLALLPNVPK